MLGRKENFRFWKLFMPHFKTAGCAKYLLEALKLHIQSSITSSPNLAHHITWNRFVNVKGGAGNNIPCDLSSEHVNKQFKCIICNMVPNLTEQLFRGQPGVSQVFATSVRDLVLSQGCHAEPLHIAPGQTMTTSRRWLV